MSADVHREQARLTQSRCIHVVESLHRGAIENWLVRMLRHACARGVDLDWSFYCVLGQPGDLDQEAKALGAHVVHSPVPLGNKTAFIRALRAELRHGGYDILHCHHDVVSALYLVAASGLPIRRRIVHVHNADESTLTPNRLKQFLFRRLGRTLCLTMADRVVGISEHTLTTFLSGRPSRPSRDRVHYYGLDPSPFERLDVDRRAFRRELGLPDNSLIMLFVGRLVPEKNPIFAVDVLAELRRIEPRAIGVFAGAGALEGAVRSRAREHGLEEAVLMLGWQNDVSKLMACSDWFILPRPDQPSNAREGFGVAVVEAQLAGLRLLLSNAISSDPLLPVARFRRLGLSMGPKAWADAARQLLSEPVPSTADALAALKQSPMDLDRALHELVGLHA